MYKFDAAKYSTHKDRSQCHATKLSVFKSAQPTFRFKTVYRSQNFDLKKRSQHNENTNGTRSIEEHFYYYVHVHDD
jgi:hypothetical protein